MPEFLNVPLGSTYSAAFSAIKMLLSAGGNRIPANEAARQAAVALDDVERCTICMTSTRGRIDTDTLLAELETVDPAARLLPQAVARQYREWVAMLDRIREWHVAANGDEPASEIVSRYMYDWHEQHVGPAEIRRRIFAAGRKMP